MGRSGVGDPGSGEDRGEEVGDELGDGDGDSKQRLRFCEEKREREVGRKRGRGKEQGARARSGLEGRWRRLRPAAREQ